MFESNDFFFWCKTLLHQTILLIHKNSCKQIPLYSELAWKALTPLFQAKTVVLVISEHLELIDKHIGKKM